MDSEIRVQTLDEADCFSHSTNNFWKGMNPIILSPYMDKLSSRVGSLSLVWATSLRERKFWIQTKKTLLKIDPVSHPAHFEGLGKYISIECISVSFQSGAMGRWGFLRSKGWNIESSESWNRESILKVSRAIVNIIIISQWCFFHGKNSSCLKSDTEVRKYCKTRSWSKET